MGNEINGKLKIPLTFILSSRIGEKKSSLSPWGRELE
jgi:hypothetical protein